MIVKSYTVSSQGGLKWLTMVQKIVLYNKAVNVKHVGLYDIDGQFLWRFMRPQIFRLYRGKGDLKQ